MAFRVEWSGPARSQFTGIANNIRAENPTAAEKFAMQVAVRIARLGTFPRSGAVYKRRRGFEVRQITYRKYRIFYRVQPRLKRIEILAVWHGARQEPKLRREK